MCCTNVCIPVQHLYTDRKYQCCTGVNFGSKFGFFGRKIDVKTVDTKVWGYFTMRFAQFLLIFGHLRTTCHHHQNFLVKFLGSWQNVVEKFKKSADFSKIYRSSCTGLRQVYRCQKYPSIDTGTGTGQAKKTCTVWSCTSFHSDKYGEWEWTLKDVVRRKGMWIIVDFLKFQGYKTIDVWLGRLICQDKILQSNSPFLFSSGFYDYVRVFVFNLCCTFDVNVHQNQ